VSELENNRLQGIGGWLLVYVILVIINLIFASIGLIYYIAEEIFSIIPIIAFILIILNIYALILIFQKKKRAIPVNIILLGLGMVGYIIMIIFNYVENQEIVGLTIFYTILGIAIGVLWLLYWLKSERVETTLIR